MFPFWDPVVAPLVRAAQARRIVEIGALRGETTVKMLEDLGPEAELHVIDPVPQFDPTEHEQRFPGQYIFHRDLSLSALPNLPAFDFALIDGDHNWYTVYNECRLLRDAARNEGVHLPLMVLHDVGWPYGRRDLYYDPTNIPEEQQQPWDRRGMTPGRKRLLKGGGMNVALANAIDEGGPRNGVRTGLDDFIAEHDQPLRQVILPIYYGLAIVAEERYLDEHPAVRSFLDQLESAEGVAQMLELSEQIRLDEVVFSHNIDRMTSGRLDRAIERHLATLRRSLLDLPGIENEARLRAAITAAVRRRPLTLDELRSPRRSTPQKFRMLEQTRDDGPTAEVPDGGGVAPTDVGRHHLDAVHAALDTVRSDGTPGDLLFVGAGRGGTAVYGRGFLDAYEDTDRKVWVADEFRAAPPDGAKPIEEAGLADMWPDLNDVRDTFERHDLLDDQVAFIQGPPVEALPPSPISSLSFAHVGRQVGADDIAAVLATIHERIVPGGQVVIEGSADTERTAAIDAFARAAALRDRTRIGWSGTRWTVTATADTTPTDQPPVVPLAPPQPGDVVDLTVVVVFYNMAREAARTLHSLSRTYQRDIDDLSYEVIVVDNGSDPDEALTTEFVASFGPEFRLVSMGSEAKPSPVPALSEGLRLGRGRHFGFMIDGAHILSPGVLHHALSGLEAYAPAIVMTQQWYVGPGQQPVTTAQGYDEVFEDQLFNEIQWPSDGYRLFEIGHFIGDRDWFDGIIESNCMFAPRALLEQVGGFDESFSTPGGGYTNLEIFDRLGAHPNTDVVTIVGEGSFHQVHSGTTTNDTEIAGRREKISGYAADFETLRGRSVSGPAKLMKYVGSFNHRAAYRTRARFVPDLAFAIDTGGVPEEPISLPDELRSAMIHGVWQTLAWQKGTWLGQPVSTPPTDLHLYQELIATHRPDHIIVAGREGGGVAHFVATVCDLIDHGSVISVGDEAIAHPRVTTIDGEIHTAAATEAITAITGGNATAMAILGSGAPAGIVKAQLEAIAPQVGSYLIVENTIVNGNPVWPSHGSGPLEALRRFLPQHPEFVVDTDLERYGLTFNLGGFLRRMT